MKRGYIILAILLLIVGYWYVTNSRVNNVSNTYEARLVTESLFEDFSWLTGTELIRLVYTYPRAQVPTAARYFIVNITIPDQIVAQLETLVQQYPELKDAFYPRVYAVRPRFDQKRFEYFRVYSVIPIEITENGVVKRLQARFIASDVPADAGYIVIQYHVPFFEDWDDNSVMASLPIFTTFEDGWQVINVFGDSRRAAIGPLYHWSDHYTPWRIIYSHDLDAIILRRTLNMPVDPYKPLLAKWYGGIEGCYGMTAILLVFELEGGSQYRVAARIDGCGWGWDSGSAISDRLSYDCLLWTSRDVMYDLSTEIPTYCPVDWRKVRRLREVQLLLRGSGRAGVSYIFIGHQAFYS